MTKHGSSSWVTAARFIVALAIIGGASGASFSAVTPLASADAAPQPGMSASDIAVAFEWAMDVERGRHGLAALVADPTVSQQAAVWSRGMAMFQTLAEDRYYAAELSAAAPNWRWSGENVGVGPTASSVQAAFMASPPHRANVLGNYTHVGVGVFVDGSGKIWVTERFYR
jgi:uncharacterized protein YkwD